jgi:hypothetical protein
MRSDAIKSVIVGDTPTFELLLVAERFHPGGDMDC